MGHGYEVKEKLAGNSSECRVVADACTGGAIGADGGGAKVSIPERVTN
jgi:hypothetical protein